MVVSVATLIHFFLLQLLVSINFSSLIGSVTGYIVSATFNYFGNCIWTFGFRQNIISTMFKFFLIALLGLFVNTFFFLIFVKSMHYMLAQFFSTICTFVITYLGNYYWTFQEKS